jgi:hypothetical protein
VSQEFLPEESFQAMTPDAFRLTNGAAVSVTRVLPRRLVHQTQNPSSISHQAASFGNEKSSSDDGQFKKDLRRTSTEDASSSSQKVTSFGEEREQEKLFFFGYNISASLAFSFEDIAFVPHRPARKQPHSSGETTTSAALPKPEKPFECNQCGLCLSTKSSLYVVEFFAPWLYYFLVFL